MMRFLTSLALVAAVSPIGFSQVAPTQVLATMKAGDGLQVELFAHEPMLINPTAIDVDHKGRVWVAEAVNYRRMLFKQPLLRQEGDRIVVLIDKDGDGKADESVVFYQGKDLYAPLSVLVLPQADGKSLRVLVAQSPDILEFWDRDGDLKADGPPTKFLSGFGGFDHDHGVHGLTVGPDGKLYFTVGDQGVNGLQSKDGKGPKFTTNKTDCQAGTVWRCDLNGNNLELIAHNFRNNYECCVDSFGEIWLSDNDDDGNQQTRICHVMPGGNYGYWPRGTGQTHWHEEQPGVVHKTLRTGFGSPTGICFYEGALLPKQYQGELIHADAGPREIRSFKRKPKGAGYELDKTLMLTSTDSWFRPSDVCVAPDGSVFVADWYDPGVGGHGMGDSTRGRIYRLTPTGHKGYKVPEVKLDTKEGVLAALASPCISLRANSYSQMTKVPFANVVGTLTDAAIRNDESILRARATWAIFNQIPLHPREPRDPTVLSTIRKVGVVVGQDKSNRIGCMMVRIFCYSGQPTLPSAVESAMLILNKQPLIREYLCALRLASADESKNFIMKSANFYDGQDIFYRAALNIACGTDPVRRDAILEHFDKVFPDWNDKVADLVWELRPKSMLPKMGELLKSVKVTATQKARIVDILAASDDVAAGKAMLALVKSDQPAEVKSRAIENLRLFLPSKWNALAKSEELKATIDTLLKDAKTTSTGLQLVAASNFSAALGDVIRVASDAGLPPDLRTHAIRTLGSIKDIKAVESLVALGTPENPLSVECVKALGEQLQSGPKSTAATQLALDSLKKAITAPKATRELRIAALTTIAGSRNGTGWLLQQQEKKELSADLVADTGRLLRNSPFQGERNKAMILFPAPGKLNPMKLPALAELAKRAGDATNGQKLMTASLTGEAQCLKCHMVRGIGGQIGPDLSMIGKKGSKENLFESILVPSKAIADQHVSWVVNTIDGQTITGLLVQETETTLTLRDANGKDYPIAAKDVEKKTKSLVSLMPEGLVATLTEDELVDMVAYLATLQTASLTPDSWSIVGPFPASGDKELDHDFGPEKGAFDIAAKFEAAGREIAWRTVRSSGTGYFDLAAFHGAAAPQSVSYLARTIESPEDQDATIQLGTDDGCRLFVNGKLAFGHERHEAATPGRDSVPVKLKKGANTVMLKINNGSNPHGFYFTILSGQELKAK